MMKAFGVALAMALLVGSSGCTVTKVADGGPFMTRAVKVPGRDVAVFASAADAPKAYTFVEDVWVRDDGSSHPDELLRNLAEKTGATGANGLILASTNRKPNGTRVDLAVRLESPFDYYSGTAIWIGPGERPVKVLRD